MMKGGGWGFTPSLLVILLQHFDEVILVHTLLDLQAPVFALGLQFGQGHLRVVDGVIIVLFIDNTLEPRRLESCFGRIQNFCNCTDNVIRLRQFQSFLIEILTVAVVVAVSVYVVMGVSVVGIVVGY